MNGKRNVLMLILVPVMFLLTSLPALAATPEQIVAAIDDGVAWLVLDQNADGSWGSWEQVAVTGFAVVKLQDRARELEADIYDDAIQAGLDYIFAHASVSPYGPLSGVCFAKGGHETYNTGIAMMAIANDGDLSQIVATGPAAGQTHGDVLQGTVDFFVFSQNPDGGWRYWAGNQPSDQSNSGYAVLGLAYAKDAGLDTSAVDAGLTNWINAIQAPDGGAEYTVGGGWENELKAGNLIFQMAFVGMGPGDPQFDAALTYIETHWRDANRDPGWGYNVYPVNCQAMYCLMKGLQYSGVDLIDTDGDGVADNDWFNQDPSMLPPQDFASVLVANQEIDGSWKDGDWGWSEPVLGTAWALLTLEKVTVVVNEPPDCSNAVADPSILWPPNHKMVSVSILGVTDPDGDPVTIEITGITSDEPTASDKGSGGAKHAPDAAGVGTDTAVLRAERSGNGNGRVYKVSFIARDDRGGESECSVNVCVPHDQGGGDACVDDGQLFDATAIN